MNNQSLLLWFCILFWTIRAMVNHTGFCTDTLLLFNKHQGVMNITELNKTSFLKRFFKQYSFELLDAIFANMPNLYFDLMFHLFLLQLQYIPMSEALAMWLDSKCFNHNGPYLVTYKCRGKWKVEADNFIVRIK